MVELRNNVRRTYRHTSGTYFISHSDRDNLHNKAGRGETHSNELNHVLLCEKIGDKIVQLSISCNAKRIGRF